MKLIRFYILLSIVIGSMSVWAATNNKPFVVVIDAGHGGSDPGAVGHISQEKDLNLQVALQAGQLIQSNYPSVQVLYTRQSDFFIPLQKRADFVNKNNANLFICVHTNSSPATSAKGMETYVLGTDKLERNLDVAMRENAVIKLEADYKTTYQGFDPNSVDSYIMFELMQNQYLDHSLDFASLLQEQFANTLKRGNRGVRQAAFWVLLKSACPSVLVEIGFISNADEERYMASANGQKAIAQAIYIAFGQFYRQTQKDKIDKTPEPQQPKPQPQPEPQPQPKPQQDEVRQPQPTVKPAPAAPQPAPQPAADTYGVQIFASHTILEENDARFHGLKGCYYIKVGEWYKYYYGKEATREKAQALKEQIKVKFPDCFVTKLPSL